MKFTSPIIAGASGSVGGATYSHNRYGQYIRNRIIPVNPSSSGQVTIRNFFATLTAIWASVLTQAQRDLWITYAANVPKTDSLGNQIFITGLNWYVASNTLRLQALQARIDAAPVVFTLAALTMPVPTASATTTSHAFTNTDLWATVVGGFLMIFQSAPQSPSHTFFKGPYRFAGKVAGAVVPPTSPQVINNPYVGVTGQRFFYRYRSLTADGRISSSIYQSDIV